MQGSGSVTVRWLLVMATGLLYYAAARLGLVWAEEGGISSFVWPASGVAVAGVVLCGWPAAVTVAIASFCALLARHHPWPIELGIAVSNGLGALSAAMLLRPGDRLRGGFDPTFRRTRDALLFVVGGAVVPALVAAALSSLVLVASGFGQEVRGDVAERVLSHSVWSIAVGPLLLSWWTDRTRPTLRAMAQLAMSMMATGLLAWGMFITQWEVLTNKVYMFFPLLVWAGLVMRVRGSSLVLAVATAGLLIWVWSARQTVPQLQGVDTWIAVQIATLQYIGIAGATVLLVAALATERDRLHELREAERALRGSEERLRLALEGSGMGDWTWNVQTDVVSLSPRAAEIFGVGPRQFITWTQLREVLEEEDRYPTQQAVERALAERAVYDVEYRVRRFDGSVGWIAAKGHGQYDTRGKPTGMVGVVLDITQRRRTEEELRDSEERFRFLTELGEATRDLADPAQVLAMVSKRLGEHLGVSRCAYADVEPDENAFTIRHDYTDGCPSSVGEYRLELFGAEVSSALRRGQTLVIDDVDQQLGRDDGGAMFNAIGIKAIVCCPLLKQGRLTALMAIHQSRPRNWTAREIGLLEDVVERSWAFIERVRAQEAVRKSETLFRQLANTIPQLAWMAQPDGTVFWYNQRWYEYTGLSAGGPVPQNWDLVDDPAHHSRVMAGFHAAVAAGRPWEDTFPLRRRDGEYRWHLSRALPLRDAEGRVILWFGTKTDVTQQRQTEAELRRAKEQAEAANAAKDQFLAVLSHELRTPLTPVLTLAELLEGRSDVPAEVREDAAAIRRNVALEARLIDDLLDLTRISRGKLELHPTHVELHGKLRHVLSMVDAEASGKQLAVQVELNATRTHLSADPARLQQIIWNLLKNAVKFTPEGGSILVRTSDLPGDRVRLRVIDTGIGIEPEVLPRIFSAFEQGNPAVTRQFGGLGLGLAISKALADLHGGLLKAESRGKGQGTTLTLELPVLTTAIPKREPPRQSRVHRSLRILFVEDHEDTARIMMRLLRRAGHQVSHAGSVAAALALAEADAFDVLLSDVGLPDGTGHDLMRRLRHRGLKGIALSGYGMEEDVRRSREAGFSEHLVKPVNLQRLEQVLGTVAEEGGPEPASDAALEPAAGL